MAGGSIQLVACGEQNIYLTGNPQITFFKVVYYRHTNFAIEAIEQSINGTVGLGKNFSCSIARYGDLLHRIYLQLEVTIKSRFSSISGAYLGFQLLNYVEVVIGEQVIDKQYGEWMAIWCDLTLPFDKAVLLGKMVDATLNSELLSSPKCRLYIPLQFWFCRNPGLALPLIALQYNDVKINFQIASNTPTVLDNNNLENATIWTDYIFLDTDERRRFTEVSHEYLIEQVQFSNSLRIPDYAASIQHELPFKNPVKELIWIIDQKNSNQNSFTNHVICKDALLQFNGQDRFKRRPGDYFTIVQRYEYHTGAGRRLLSENLIQSAFNSSSAFCATHIYSFALKPEEYQTSGTCNFSRIDNAVLNITLDTNYDNAFLRVYAVNYNILRIMGGMGGLTYSN